MLSSKFSEMNSESEASPSVTPQPQILDDYMNCIPIEAGNQRDISSEAVWSLSSCKVGMSPFYTSSMMRLEGFGINQLLDERTLNFWQSDGPQPHIITIEFQKYTEISFLLLYLDFKSDESYTPQK